MHKTLDLTNITTELDFHNYVSDQLEFPYYYGKNWDAFWDCITDEVLSYDEYTLEINIESTKAVYYNDLLYFLDKLKNYYPPFNYFIMYTKPLI